MFTFLPKQFTVGVLNAFLVCPPWLGCRVRLAGLVFLLSPVLSPIWSGMLCPPVWVCFFLVSGLGLGCRVRLLGLSPSPACLPSCLPAGLGCRVRPLGLSPKFARFVQPFGVYGGVIYKKLQKRIFNKTRSTKDFVEKCSAKKHAPKRDTLWFV